MILRAESATPPMSLEEPDPQQNRGRRFRAWHITSTAIRCPESANAIQGRRVNRVWQRAGPIASTADPALGNFANTQRRCTSPTAIAWSARRNRKPADVAPAMGDLCRSRKLPLGRNSLAAFVLAFGFRRRWARKCAACGVR
jgi:hypothetical protein